MKALIDVLKVKPCSEQELTDVLRSNFPARSKDALRKKRTRFLKKFEQWGLVEKRGDKYCWYIYVNLFENEGKENYSIKLEHSRSLVPALRRIAAIIEPRYTLSSVSKEYESMEDQKIHDEWAQNHLRAYADASSLLDKYRELNTKAEQQKEIFKTRVMDKLEEKLGKTKIVDSSKSARKNAMSSFVLSNIPSIICSLVVYNKPLSMHEDNEEIWLGDSLIAKRAKEDKGLFGKIDAFVRREIKDESNIALARQITEILKEAFGAQGKFQQELRQLLMRIDESGEPLLGGCNGCPKVYFSKRT
jgi:hypothetical protein